MSTMPGEMDQQTYTTTYDVQVQGQQGLNSMLEITNQYSAAADNLLGRVARLNVGIVGLTKSWIGMKPANAGAISEAARYQQQLSGLEATVKVSTASNTGYHESFSQLRDDTKALAREMPIGMTQAIQQVDQLQQSGVKSNKEIASLARTYTELGKATGEFGPALGADMQSLNQQYAANTKQAQGYADSLTTVTNRLGGTASGTLQFAKSIAPIAATVGMGESQVIGLSNAFSKMGEDGYGAATAVNKVLLDLNRSVRQGTPEMSQYAKLLDMSSADLTKLFKSNPAEVLTQFTEAIRKKGPEAVTALDNLGLDGIRTVRSVQAVAQGGGLRQSIQTAVGAYNNGMTKTGAETATSGLNDQMAKLQETTRQTIEATGRPFLAWLTDVTKLANGAASAIRKMVDNPIAQGIGSAGAAVGIGGSDLMHLASLGVTAAFARNLLRGGFRMAGSARDDFRIGRQAMVSTGDAQLARESALNSPFMAGLGARYGGLTGTMGADPGLGIPWRARSLSAARAAGEAARRASLAGMGTIAAAGRSARFDVEQARSQDGLRPTTPARDAYRARMDAIRAAGRPLAPGEFGPSPMPYAYRAGARLDASGSLLSSGLAQDLTRTQAARMAAGESLAAGRAGLAYSMGMGRSLIGAGVRGTGAMLGTTAAGIAGLVSAPVLVGGALVGGYQYHKAQVDQTRAAAEEVHGASSDPYRAYNDFAAAMGNAGRSASGFANEAEQAAKRLAEINPTQGDAYKFTATEAQQARGYRGPHALVLSGAEQGQAGLLQRAGNMISRFAHGGSWGDIFHNAGAPDRASTSELTAKIALTLGDRGTKEDISRALFDIAGQGVGQSQVQAVANNLKQIYGSTGRGVPDVGMGISAAISSQKRVAGGQGATQDAQEFMANVFGQVGQAAEREGAVRGDKSAQAAQYAELNKVMADYAKQRRSVDSSHRGKLDELYAAGVSGVLGVSEGDVKGNLGATSVSQLLRGIKHPSKDAQNALSAYQALGLGTSVSDADLLRLGQQPRAIGAERSATRSLDADFEAVTHFKAHGQAWDKGLHGIDEQLFAMGKTLETGGKALESGMDPLQKALYDLQTNTPDARRTFLAGQQLANAQLGMRGGNASAATLGLAVSGAQIGDNPALQQAFAAAQDYVSKVIQPVVQAKASPVDALRQQIQTGQVAQRQLQNPSFDDPAAQQVAQDQVAAGAQARAQLIQMRRQYAQQVIDTMRSIRINEEQEQISEKRMNEDYQRSRLYSEQDFDLQIMRARRDFNKQMQRAEQDFTKSVRRGEEDYQISRTRAEEDYNRSRLRATEDFNKQQSRAISDHQRQVEYMLKDSASQMYDPYKRIQAADVMDASGLASNINQQADMLRRQSANVKKLKQLGLSQRTIDSLDLYNPANAYQAERLVQDIEQDQRQVANLNSAVAGKDAAAAPLATSSESFRRSEEEFGISLQRSSDDFNTSLTRMAEDHRTSMDRMAEDQLRNLKRMRADNAQQLKRANADFATSMADMFTSQKMALGRMASANELALKRARQDIATSTKITLTQLGQAGTALTMSAGQISDLAAREIAMAPARWTGPLMKTVQTMMAALRATAAAGMPSALTIPLSTKGISSGSANFLNSYMGPSTNPSTSLFPHALGGIAQTPHAGIIAEAGYPEALIPLNERGASMLHQVLQRYATSDQTKGMYGQSYAAVQPTPQVITYDYSTRIEHVTVVANDPHEMYRQLDNIAATKRLIQPAGNS